MTKDEIACRYRERHRDELRTKALVYYYANKERVIARFKEAKERGGLSWREKESARNRFWKARNRLAILELLGGSCARCGFNDRRALQIDHVNGGGYKALREVASLNTYYRQIREAVAQETSEYQVLCANCNQIKRHEKDEFYRTHKLIPAPD